MPLIYPLPAGASRAWFRLRRFQPLSYKEARVLSTATGETDEKIADNCRARSFDRRPDVSRHERNVPGADSIPEEESRQGGAGHGDGAASRRSLPQAPARALPAQQRLQDPRRQ